MKNGICPKCNSSEVYVGTKSLLRRVIYGQNSIPILPFVSAKLENIVCAKCGYVENYITDTSVLDYIKKKWPKVKPVAQ